MGSTQEMRYETSMAIFHSDPVGAYKKAIERHQGAIKRLRKLIRTLNRERR